MVTRWIQKYTRRHSVDRTTGGTDWMSGVLCDRWIPSLYPQDNSSANYAVATVPMTSSHVKKLEVTEMKMCRWAYGHTLKIPCEKRWQQGETEGREYHRELQESKIEMVWTHKKARPRIVYVGRKTLEMVPPAWERRKRGLCCSPCPPFCQCSCSVLAWLSLSATFTASSLLSLVDANYHLTMDWIMF